MSAVDFESWALPDLELTLGGRTYVVPPPSTEAAGQILAAAVRAEVKLGLVEGPVPPEVQAVLDTIGDAHPALGEKVWQQLIDDNVLPPVRDRLAYYAVFYWAKGKEFADWIAATLWGPEAAAERRDRAGGGAAPKGS